MSAKTSLPVLDDELAPRRVNLRAIQPRGIDEATVVENSRRLGEEWGAQTTLDVPRPKIAMGSLRIEVPEYLDRELTLKAANLRVTKQFLVTQALRDAGYHVEPEDLVHDKRKAKR